MGRGSPIKTEITARGQECVDVPVFLKPTKISDAVRKAFDRRPYPPILLRYDRHRLNWK